MSKTADTSGVFMSKPATKAPLRARTVPLPTVILITVFVALVSFVTGTRSNEIVARFDGKQNPASLDLSSLNDIYGVLRSKYDGKLDTQALIDGAKHGLVEATGDPYTT